MLRRAHASVRLLVSCTLAIALLLVLYKRQSLQDFASDFSSSQFTHSNPPYLSTSLNPDIDSPSNNANHASDASTTNYSYDDENNNDDDDTAHRLAVHDAKTHAGSLSKRVIVASLKSEDTRWTQRDLPEGWEPWVYVVDANIPGTRHTPINKGREAGVFLWYLVSEYDNLAETNVFLHAHKAGYPAAWHVDNEVHSNPLSVRRLRLDTVQKDGYVNLRCLPVPGCPEDVQPFRDPPDPDRSEEHAIRDAWTTLFPDTLHVPQVIAAPCCSQFAVSREQAHRRPKADYERFYRWLRDTDLPDDVSGRVFEYLWHIIFGQDAVSCPALENCYCDVYGDGCLDGIL